MIKQFRKNLVFYCVLLGFVFAPIVTSAGQKVPPNDGKKDHINNLVSEIISSIVTVNAYSPKNSGDKQGTGFFISPDGYIATNWHVLVGDGYKPTVTLTDGEELRAELVGKDPAKDLAVLKIEGNGYKPLPLGDSDSLQLGQDVVAIGNTPDHTASVGSVTAFDRNIRGRSRDYEENLNGLVETDSNINAGQSGGPAVDLDGRVVGVNVASNGNVPNREKDIGFIIPINDLKDYLWAFP